MKITTYHGTNQSFKTPDFNRINETTGDLVYSNFGFYTTTNKQYANDYAQYKAQWDGGSPTILKCHITINSLFEITESDLQNICTDEASAARMKAELTESGFDTIKIVTDRGIEYCSLCPEQVFIITKK